MRLPAPGNRCAARSDDFSTTVAGIARWRQHLSARSAHRQHCDSAAGARNSCDAVRLRSPDAENGLNAMGVPRPVRMPERIHAPGHTGHRRHNDAERCEHRLQVINRAIGALGLSRCRLRIVMTAAAETRRARAHAARNLAVNARPGRCRHRATGCSGWWCRLSRFA